MHTDKSNKEAAAHATASSVFIEFQTPRKALRKLSASVPCRVGASIFRAPQGVGMKESIKCRFCRAPSLCDR